LQVFGDEANLYNLEDIQVQDMGQISEVSITKDDTLLMKVSEDSTGFIRKIRSSKIV
jgi:hypothetical protein